MKHIFTFFLLCLCGNSLYAMIQLLPTPQDGMLDPEFNLVSFIAGTQTNNINFNTSDQAVGTIIQFDGNIIAVGSTLQLQTSVQNWALARYTTFGQLDRTFKQGTNNVVPGTITTTFGGTNESAVDVAVQADGIIVVGGYTNVNGNLQFALAFYNSDGSFHTSLLNPTGKTITPRFSPNSTDAPYALTLQPDGKIILAGYTTDAAGITNFALARYEPNGILDFSFGTGGKVIGPVIGIDSEDELYAVTIDANSKIVATGITTTENGNGITNFVVVRYNTDGTLDTATFNPLGIGSPAGTVVTNLGGSRNIARALLVQPDGKIIVGGSSNNMGFGLNFALARYHDDGSLDTSFNGTGTLTLIVNSNDDNIQTLALQQNGQIIAAGASGSVGVNAVFIIARITSTGALATNFDTSVTPGYAITSISSRNDSFQASASQTDGKIVAVGFAGSLVNQYQFALARYLDNNPLAAVTIIAPADGDVLTINKPTYRGTAPNPSNIILFVNGIRYDQGVTTGASNTWTLTPLAPLLPGLNTIQVVAQYKNGSVNIISDSITVSLSVSTS